MANDRPTLIGSAGHYLGIVALLVMALAMLGTGLAPVFLALILGVLAIVLGAIGGLRSGVIMGVLTVLGVAFVVLAYSY